MKLKASANKAVNPIGASDGFQSYLAAGLRMARKGEGIGEQEMGFIPCSTPNDRWTVIPEELNRAVDEAKTELERFAGEISRILPMLGFQEDPVVMGRKLAGLCV